MIQMKRAARSDRAAVCALWQAEFGDGPEFIDAFCAWCGWEQIFLLWDDGVPRTMVAAPLVEVTMPGGGRARAGYLYALTTDRTVRGGGFGHMILNYADFCLKNQGADCAVLVPAQPSLFRFFGSAGYRPAFTLWEGRADAGELGPAPAGSGLEGADPARYLALQEERLAGLPHVVSPLGLLEQQRALCRSAGGDLYALDLPHGPGCAAAERLPDGTAVVRELLAPPGDGEAALALLHRELAAASYLVRRPLAGGEAGGGNARPFGAVNWYDREKAAQWGGRETAYLGLALD